MKIADLFDTRVEEKIEPVIKVGEVGDEPKLAGEIGSYVVTPTIEQYLDDMLEHYTDTFFKSTTEIGIWISGYFGSGKSHFAKILALLAGNRILAGTPACKRFEARIPTDAPRRSSILRSLGRMDQCATDVLAFNINSLADSKTRSLSSLLLSQFYLSLGYSSNLIYARVIEAELDKQGKLAALHEAVEQRAGKPWADIQQNLSFYSTHLYAAACEVSDVFETTGDVQDALKVAQQGEIHNVVFLVDTLLDHLKKREAETKKPQRLLLVLDESGQWIEDDKERLSKLQAFVEEAAIRGQGKLWIIVTTHGDIGSIYKEARALDGDMKKIEGRFRFKPALTTENIELVLEDRLFKKKLAGTQELQGLYTRRGGVLRGLGELANITGRTLPACDEGKFPVYYPFFPYQVNLIPEIVKTLRSKGGRGEQLSGSTRTLLAITQDILRAGRRQYLDDGVGALVSFDEVYHNLSHEGEIPPDVRDELARIPESVPGAGPLTQHLAEVLYLIREIPFIPRTQDNIARMMVETADDDLPTILARIQPELDRLIAARMVARIGEEYEFLTGERRTFEDEVTTVEEQLRHQDRERGLVEHFVQEPGKAHWRNWLGADVVTYHERDFSFRLRVDESVVPGTKGDVTLKFCTPLSLGQVTLADLENQSLRPDEQITLFFLCGRVPAFDQDLTRYLGMLEVIGNWKGDSRKSEEARELAMDRETNDLPKLHRRVVDGLKEGIRTGHLVFRGSNRQLRVRPNQKPGEALRAEMGTVWPTLYPKFDRVTVRITNDQKAIPDVLSGASNPPKEVKALKLYDRSGKVDPHCPLLDAVRIHLSTEQNSGRRVLGKGLLETFSAPPFGWDPNAVRVGVAALVRAGAVKVLISKKPFTNPADPELVDAIRVSRSFDRVELVLEETEVDPDVLTETRKFIMKLARKRGIDETPAALSAAAGDLATAILEKAAHVNLWASGSGMPLPAAFTDGEDAWQQIVELANPVHRVNEVHTSRDTLAAGHTTIEAHDTFQDQNGALFSELKTTVDQLSAIEHRFGTDSCVRSLLDDYSTARASASFADKEVWKRLQGHKAQAALELPPLMDGWRGEARQQLQAALDRLPNDLAEQGLVPSLRDSLAAPLEKLRDGLDDVTHPSQVAILPNQAAQTVRELGQEIAKAVREKQDEEDNKKGKKVDPKPKRQVRSLRTSDVATVTVVSNEAQWEVLRDKVDKRVRELLAEGFDVEVG